MRKYMENKENFTDLKIYSIVSLENINGIIYIEANSLKSVQNLIQNFNNIKTPLVKLVPMSQFE